VIQQNGWEQKHTYGVWVTDLLRTHFGLDRPKGAPKIK